MSPEPSLIQGDSDYQSRMLEETAAAKNYREWLVSLALPYIGDKPLEVGSGIGDYAEEFGLRGAHVTASEAHPERLIQLHERFAGNPNVAVRELAVPVRDTGDYSSVVAYNVLEHIPDDVDALRGLAPLLRPQGRLILFVPAFPIAMSELDRRIGHQRRYRRRTLRRAVETAGYDVEVLHHVNSIGLLAWIVVMRLLRGETAAGPGLRIYDSLVIPVIRAIESRIRPPFGQSLFIVARKR